MKKFIQDCQPNDRLTSFFLVQAKEVRTKKNSGEPYLSLMLSDRTGRIEAKMWDGVEEIVDAFDRDDIVKVKANIQLFRDKPQMIVQQLRRADDSEVDLGDFIPHTKSDIGTMFAELRAAVREFRNPHLKALLDAFLDDPEVAGRLREAPAAKSLHHACVGGLLEHVCSLMNLARLVASNYGYLDAELLLTGVVLHDIGKIDELTYGRSFGYSGEGQLIGHIPIALQMIERKTAAIEGFPPRLKQLIDHMVLSHHGRYEFGSPKLPMFPEALALSYIDDLDSKLESMRASLDSDPAEDPAWTRFNPALERPILNAARYLMETAPAPAPEAAPVHEAPPLQPPPPLPRKTAPPATPGLFGEKLQSALGPSRAKE